MRYYRQIRRGMAESISKFNWRRPVDVLGILALCAASYLAGQANKEDERASTESLVEAEHPDSQVPIYRYASDFTIQHVIGYTPHAFDIVCAYGHDPTSAHPKLSLSDAVYHVSAEDERGNSVVGFVPAEEVAWVRSSIRECPN